MATIAVGTVETVFCPFDGTITVTPGTSGKVSINARSRDGSQGIAPRELYAAETLTVSAGDVVSMEAINVAATYTGTSTITTPDGGIVALAETSPYVTPTASTGSSAFSGACELAGWYCSVAAGTITIYDALSATGTPIVPATTLVVGPMPIMGAGTTGKIALTTGCWVVLSGAATVRVLVA